MPQDISEQASPNKPSKSTKKKDSIIISALYFAAGTFSSRIFGFVRDSLIFALLPLTVRDAWYAAFRAPNLFRRLLGEGALASCFIPVYVSTKSNEERSYLVGGVAMSLVLSVSLVCGLCIYFMDELMLYWLAGKGFTSVPGKVELTVHLARIMFGFLACMSGFAFIMSLLNAHKTFFITAFAPAFFNVVVIAGALIAYWQKVTQAEFLAWSVLVGGALQFVILLPWYSKFSIRWNFSWKSLTHKRTKSVFTKFLPTLFGVGILQLMSLVNVYFASQLEEGAISFIYAADRLLELPLSLISVSLGAAMLPTLSKYVGDGHTKKLKKEVKSTLSFMLFLSFPAGVGLALMAEPLTQVMFERGAFTQSHTLAVAELVRIYGVTLVITGLARFASQLLYACKDTKTPALASFIALCIHLILAPELMGSLGLRGLILSTVCVTTVSLLTQWVVLTYRYKLNFFGGLTSSFLRSFFASLTMGLVLYGLISQLGEWSAIVKVLLFIPVAMVTYFLVHLLVKGEEMSVLRLKLNQRLSRK